MYVNSVVTYINIKLFIRTPYNFLIPVQFLAMFLLSSTTILVHSVFPLALITLSRALLNLLIFSKNKLLLLTI